MRIDDQASEFRWGGTPGRRVWGVLAAVLLSWPAAAQVVINEVFYHAPGDDPDLQWIELHNAGEQTAPLGGWTLTKGVKFAFPEGTVIPAHGHLVVCKNREPFEEFYRAPVAGEFGKALKRSGERLDLRNAAGDVVDTVTFGDRPPWPVAPDGWSASLERICPGAPGSLPENWAASPLSEDAARPGGTPGARNAAYASHLPPAIRDVEYAAFPAPGQPVAVRATVQALEGLREVTLRFRVVGPGAESEEQTLPMRAPGPLGLAYSASIPAQPAGRVVRFRVQATDRLGASRTYPGENEPRPALSCAVLPNLEPGRIPVGWLVNPDAASSGGLRRPGGGFGGPGGFFGGPGGGDRVDRFEGRGPEGGPGGGPAAVPFPGAGLPPGDRDNLRGPPGADGPPAAPPGPPADPAPRRGGDRNASPGGRPPTGLRGPGGPGGPRGGPFPGPGGPFGNPDFLRAMAQTQVRSALDLSSLWASVTLGPEPAADLERVRAVFIRQVAEREQLERRMLASTNLAASAAEVPNLGKAFKDGVAEALKPVLNPRQTQALEAWQRSPSPGGGFGGFGGFFGGDPAAAARQTVRLEPAYLYLATGAGTTPAQFASLRELYRDAIRQRDALASEPRAPMGFMGGDASQVRLEALSARVTKRLKDLLTPAQNRRFTAWRAQDRPPSLGRGGPKPPRPPRGSSAFVYLDPKTGVPQLFDFVRVTERSGGFKIHFHRDQPLEGMTAVNLVFKMNERWALTEPLAYEMHERAGLHVFRTGHVRLWMDGEPVGYYFAFAQPNRAFWRQAGLGEDGNLYKANWQGQGLAGQNEKKSNARTGHDDLIELVGQLEETRSDPAAQWKLIEREFDVPQVATHYAVRLLLSDWDGFFNNYYLYHDVSGTKKWTLYVWDQDQTWGDGGGFGGAGRLLDDLPLSFGAEGDRPPGGQGGGPGGFMGPGMGGAFWWRPGGYISKPLLANPAFRRHVLARLKELLTAQFTEARAFPAIDQLGDRLREEVRFRAQAARDDPQRALERFEANLASLKQFVVKRRAWLLAQDEVRTAGAP